MKSRLTITLLDDDLRLVAILKQKLEQANNNIKISNANVIRVALKYLEENKQF